MAAPPASWSAGLPARPCAGLGRPAARGTAAARHRRPIAAARSRRATAAAPPSRAAGCAGPARRPSPGLERRRSPSGRRPASSGRRSGSGSEAAAARPASRRRSTHRRLRVVRRPVIAQRPMPRRQPAPAAAHPGRRARSARLAARSSRLAPGPVLERRADREGAREAVRLLVGEGARRRARLGVAAVAMVGDGRPLVAIVLEGDEGTGRGTVRDGQSAFRHAPMIPAASGSVRSAVRAGSSGPRRAPRDRSRPVAGGSRLSAEVPRAVAARRRDVARPLRPVRRSRARVVFPTSPELLEDPQLEQAGMLVEQRRRRSPATAARRSRRGRARAPPRPRAARRRSPAKARLSSAGTITSRTSTPSSSTPIRARSLATAPADRRPELGPGRQRARRPCGPRARTEAGVERRVERRTASSGRS